jgi:deoxyribodipyrimidine photo-lyase
MVPALRVTARNAAPVRPDRSFVLYWMTAARRPRANFGLDHAIDRARELHKPLVVLEALRCGYRWASDRIHAFVLQGMADNRDAFARTPVVYHPYVERTHGSGKGLLAALAQHACAVVTDEFPCFFLPSMLAAAAHRLDVCLEAVDGNGLLPLRATAAPFLRAVDLRRFLQRHLADHLATAPRQEPLRRLELPQLARLPDEVTRRWPAAAAAELDGRDLAMLPIDHAVAPVAGLAGGHRGGAARLRSFLEHGLRDYAERRSHPDADAQSGLSPWLHFGHVGVHQVLHELARHEGWSADRLGSRADGKREGFWGMSTNAEAFLDELVTWRELGFLTCHHRPGDYDRFESLPAWARVTLAAHAGDARPALYSPAELAAASTGDELWNAAQHQLTAGGTIHNYLRMLWGKKILEWTPTPQDAFAVMVELNNRFAVDGRDPNSYSGISWVLGRYDRPWGPERPVFGTVRYMTSESTKRKLRLREWLARWSVPSPAVAKPSNGAARARPPRGAAPRRRS